MGTSRSQRHLIEQYGVNSAGEGWGLPDSPGFTWPLGCSGVAQLFAWVRAANDRTRLPSADFHINGFPAPNYTTQAFTRTFTVPIVGLSAAQILDAIRVQLDADTLDFAYVVDNFDPAMLHVTLADHALEIRSP